MRKLSLLLVLAAVVAAVYGITLARPATTTVDLKSRTLSNRLAYIPPQCFTDTAAKGDGRAQNPCYVCHANARTPNENSQPENQLIYAFPETRAVGRIENQWTNFFVDQRPRTARISDSEIDRWVNTSNYRDGDQLLPAQRLQRELPGSWDVNDNGVWDGYTPDAWFDFDDAGFDRAPNGQMTWWRAFAYYPFPGSFMPTNGSFDDVLIRLPAEFRETADGKADLAIYKTNLAIVEAMIRRSDVPIDPVDESALGVDLDGDGKLASADHIRYDWAPLQGRNMVYVGRAGQSLAAGTQKIAAGLFPVGTEFLHSVRYLRVTTDGAVLPAPRMKELRYARKTSWLNYSTLRDMALDETKEAFIDPDRAELLLGNPESGMANAIGWSYQGMIEDASGALRPQTFEETAFCMGCHRGLSATEDGTFAFARKRSDGPQRGWTHTVDSATYHVPDPLREDGQREYASYLRANLAGDEYRSNDEIRHRYFDDKGQARAEAFAALEGDIATLMLPSAERARALNKAYRVLVQDQAYIRGRDAVLAPAEHMLHAAQIDQATGITEALEAPRLVYAPAGDGAR